MELQKLLHAPHGWSNSAESLLAGLQVFRYVQVYESFSFGDEVICDVVICVRRILFILVRIVSTFVFNFICLLLFKNCLPILIIMFKKMSMYVTIGRKVLHEGKSFIEVSFFPLVLYIDKKIHLGFMSYPMYVKGRRSNFCDLPIKEFSVRSLCR